MEDDATDDFISKDGQIDNEPLWVPAKITSNDNVLLVGQLFCSNCRSLTYMVITNTTDEREILSQLSVSCQQLFANTNREMME